MMTLSVIILSYNTRDLTLACLQSLTTALTHLDAEIIVVDNASSDDSAQAIQALKITNLTLIQNAQNVGFAAANNQGMKIARGQYFLLLNSDTTIEPDALDKLIQFMSHSPEIAAVTPKVILPNGQLDLACHRGMPTPLNALTYFTRLEALFPKIPWLSGYHQLSLDLNTPHRLEATAATALLIRRAAVNTIGYLDERFFLYGEDLDWCQRLKDAGLTLWYYPSAVVYHHKSASGKNQSHSRAERRRSVDHFYHTMKQFYDKHYLTRYPSWLRHLVYWGIDLKQKLHR